MPRAKHTAPIPYVHPDDPAGYLKPGDTLMAGGYDFAWCYVWFKEVPGRPGYRVGHDGAVWSCIKRGGNIQVRGILTDQWHRLNPFPDTYGHLRVVLKGRVFRYVHQLVLDAFVGPCPPGLECRHLDGNRRNNLVWNLRWGTKKQNMEDMVIHGNSLKGRRAPAAVMTEEGVIELLAMRRDGKTIKFLARWFGVSYHTVWKIINGEGWCHVTGLSPARHGGYPKGEEHYGTILTESAVREALAMRRDGKRAVDIAQSLGVARGTISSIFRGRSWAWVTGLSPTRRG
jgi:molybdenum-dependent DNA-binding transcriptional regulator ModE